MPRPQKCRKICNLPKCTAFGPKEQDLSPPVNLQIDEYEAIRLIDFENMTQEECAKQMEVARTTVQAIYASARKKLAECLVKSSPLLIEGGDYKLCSKSQKNCHKTCCLKNGKNFKHPEEK